MSELAKPKENTAGPAKAALTTDTAPKTGQTQYKATRIWYEIINSFREEVPLKKHWRNFRTYQDCFSASEAVEWLFKYLKSSPNFKSHTTLTRQQAIQLLQIFLKEKIIEDVRASDVKFTFKEFQDDDRLYKFCTNNRFYKNATKAAETSKTEQAKTTTAEAVAETKEQSAKAVVEVAPASVPAKVLGVKKGLSNVNEKLAEIKEKLNEASKPSEAKKSQNKENVEPVPMTPKQQTSAGKSLSVSVVKEPLLDSVKSCDVKLFASKLSTTSGSVNKTVSVVRAASLKRKPTIARAHHYSNGKYIPMKLTKSEEEVWARVAHKLLESIVKKALAFNQSATCLSTLTTAPTSAGSVTRMLFEEASLDEHFRPSSIISGANLNHNCTHVNKHGVVIDTDDDFPPWLVKAMTCLMNWKEEPGEFPRFQDVFSEVNNHFTELKEPLVTGTIGNILRRVMGVLLIPRNYHNQKLSATIESFPKIDQSNPGHSHETNKKTFDTLMLNLRSQMLMNSNSSVSLAEQSSSGFFPNSSAIRSTRGSSCSQMPLRPSFLDEEEMKLIENAKLPLIHESRAGNERVAMETTSNEQKQQLIQDIFLASVVELEECCEDCLHKYNAINHFINKNAIEFNEFVSSLNCLDAAEGFQVKCDTSDSSMIDSYEFNRQSKQRMQTDHQLCHSNAIYGQHQETDIDMAIKLKESQERFANLKLKFSPIKNDSDKSKTVASPARSKTLAKSVSEKRLHRNNSFRTAIGEIDMKNESLSTAFPTIQPSKIQKRTPQIESAIQRSLKQSQADEANFKRPCDPADSGGCSQLQYIGKSVSMNSIQGMLSQSTEDSTPTGYTEKKRKMMQSSTNSLSEKPNHAYQDQGSTWGVPHSSSLNRNSSLNVSESTDGAKHQLRTLKSYSDLCCSGGFDPQRNLNKYFSNSMNLDSIVAATPDSNEDSCSVASSSRSFWKNSNVSLNTLSGLLLKNTSQSMKSDQEQQRRAFFHRTFSLSSEIESETLCFMIKAFRICALMLPPTNKRKLHLLLRFLYKLRYDQHSCKYLVEADEATKAPKKTCMDSIMEDVRFIDESLNMNSHNCSSDYANPFATSTGSCSSSHRAQTAAQNARDLEAKSKAIEAIIIKSFFRSIVPVRRDKSASRRRSQPQLGQRQDMYQLDLSAQEEELMAMKMVQVLINNYPEIMRIPDELIANVNHRLSSSKSSGSLHQIQGSTAFIDSKVCDYSTSSASKSSDALSKQQLTELLNSILTDMLMKDKERLARLKQFKELHPDVYEEKYPTIKKALNILGLNDSAAFLVPNIHLIQNSFCSTDSTGYNRRESDYCSLKKRTALAKLTESAKKRTGFTGASLNQTAIGTTTSSSSHSVSSSTSSSASSFNKFFNKRKKENLI